MEPALFLGLALALGVKHAFDADHLAATGVFLTRAPGPRGAVRLGLRWGLGHTLTAGVLSVALFLGRDAFLAAWREPLELLVAATLLLVGAASIVLELRVVHTHPHAHGGAEHTHRHLHLFGRDAHHAMFGLGALQGLASNDELVLLLTASLGVVSLAGLLAGVAFFSAGVIVGMALFATALALPLVRARSGQVRRAVVVAAGAASVLTGLGMLA